MSTQVLIIGIASILIVLAVVDYIVYKKKKEKSKK